MNQGKLITYITLVLAAAEHGRTGEPSEAVQALAQDLDFNPPEEGDQLKDTLEAAIDQLETLVLDEPEPREPAEKKPGAAAKPVAKQTPG